MARGIDHRPLVRPLNEETIVEEMYLNEETNSFSIIRRHVHHLTEKATFRLRQRNKFAQKIYLSLRYSDFKLVESQQKTREPFQTTFEIEKITSRLLSQLFYRRTNIRFIGLELSGFCLQFKQLSFLDQLEPKSTNKKKSAAH